MCPYKIRERGKRDDATSSGKIIFQKVLLNTGSCCNLIYNKLMLISQESLYQAFE